MLLILRTLLLSGMRPGPLWRTPAAERGPTLAQFAFPGVRGIVLIAHHVIAVEDCLVVDTHALVPMWVHDHPFCRRHVRAFLEVPERAALQRVTGTRKNSLRGQGRVP